MNIIKLKASVLLMLTFICVLICANETRVLAADRVQPIGDELVIVIDPGHGGDNLGTQSGHTIEKEMTMVTAKAMYEELLKYDDVTVYMTHTDDVDLSLKERAEFAASVNADFLFSIHYNASEYHTMYGTEVWISCQTPYNAYGYQFGYLHLKEMEKMGLFLRGVKNRQNNDKEDYYGIIRESAALSVPAVIIEHCYVDEERDAEYVKNAEDFATFGRTNALSVAKYFGLKSSVLNVDYSAEASNLQPAEADKPVQYTLPDKTAPDVCEIELVECDYETGNVQITVRAADYDTALIYYSYSINGGASWSRLESWPGSNALTGEYADTFQLNLQIPAGRKPSIIVKAFNITDLDTRSNTLQFDQKFGPTKETTQTTTNISSGDVSVKEDAAVSTTPPEHEHKTVGTTTFMPVYSDTTEDDTGQIMVFLKLCLALVIVMFLIVLTTQIVHYNRRKARRRKK